MIVIEGIDGAGKTTLMNALATALRARGLEVVVTKEPTEGPYGRKIREIASKSRDRISAEEEFQLFHADRKEHVAQVVRPALARGAVVLQDRSYFSTVAYQGERGLDRARLLEMSEAIAPKPDLLLVVDLPPEIALARIQARGIARDDFEVLDALGRIRSVFLALPDKTVIDATRPPDEAAAQALAHVLDALR